MKVSAASAAAAVLFALVVSVQSSDSLNATATSHKSGATKTSPATATAPTRLPVKSSTPTAHTTYARDHAHANATRPGAEATTAATSAATTAKKSHETVAATKTGANVTHAAGNATTPKPQPMSEGHVVLKQKLNSIAVRCKDELHAPQEIMALVSNTVVPQNEQQRCYLECVYKALNLVKNNKFSVADGKKLAQIRFAAQPSELKKAVTIIETCEKEVVVDPKSTEKCAAGRIIRNCFVKNGEKINFFPKA